MFRNSRICYDCGKRIRFRRILCGECSRRNKQKDRRDSRMRSERRGRRG